MPDPFSGFGIKCNQRVCEEVVSRPISAIVVIRRRTSGCKDQPSLCIDAQSRPAIGCASPYPGVRRPGLVPILSRVGNGVKPPAQLSGANVISTDVPWRSGQIFADLASDDQHILIDDSGAGSRHSQPLDITTQVVSEINPSVLTEGRDGPAALCIKCIEKIIDHGKNSSVTVFILPVCDSSQAESPVDFRSLVRIESPYHLTSICFEGDYVDLRTGHI